MKTSIRRFDQKVERLVKRLPRSVHGFMEFMTLLGQPPVTVGLATAVIGYGAALEKTHFVVSGTIAIGTITFASLLKLALRRARPINDYVKNMFFHTYSFPSGHAAGAVASLGLAAILLSERIPEYTVAFCITAAAISLFIGVSRVYLGAHYASDVVGGWIVGIIGVIAIAIIEIES